MMFARLFWIYILVVLSSRNLQEFASADAVSAMLAAALLLKNRFHSTLAFSNERMSRSKIS